jgi:hypothetical protein
MLFPAGKNFSSPFESIKTLRTSLLGKIKITEKMSYGEFQ